MTVIVKIEYPNHECDADHLIAELSPHEDADLFYRTLKTELERKITSAEEDMDFLDVLDARIKNVIDKCFEGTTYRFLGSDYVISASV